MADVPSFPRESVEFLAAPVTVDGAVVTTGVEYAVTTGSDRPTVWTAATLLGGRTGIMVQGYAPGYWNVWARVSSAPETPVVQCGTFQVT